MAMEGAKQIHDAGRRADELAALCGRASKNREKPKTSPSSSEAIPTVQEKQVSTIGDKGAVNPKKVADKLSQDATDKKLVDGYRWFFEKPSSDDNAKIEQPAGKSIVDIAKSYEGRKGFDCSGFVSEVLGQEHIRSTQIISNYCQNISSKDIQPGDIIYGRLKDNGKLGPDHIMIATGSVKDGTISFIHTASSQGRRVFEQADFPVSQIVNMKVGRVKPEILAQLSDKKTQFAQNDINSKKA